MFTTEGLILDQFASENNPEYECDDVSKFSPAEINAQTPAGESVPASEMPPNYFKTEESQQWINGCTAGITSP
jgi:hypothetical protein